MSVDMAAPPYNNDWPTISQIYAAFSPESHEVFQAAMACSRGGVVRVQDLLTGLVSHQLEIARRVLPERWRLSSSERSSDENHLVPMANEPALREVLRAAFAVARAQPSPNAPDISPATLWASVLMQRRMTCGLSNQELLLRLGLDCPPELRTPVDLGVRARHVERTPTVEELGRLFDGRDMVDVILERWLAAQSLPRGAERERELERIAVLTRHLESQA